ncbi:MAG: putative prokaryotic signal transducing protein [Chloroflexota bacterium]|nr:putative prokaryotic signal transducing protein [Chloroflexota bacterium]
MSEEDWVVLQSAEQMEAEVLRAALETAGIPVVTTSEFVGRLYGLTSQELGAVRLLVPRSRVEEARELVNGSSAIDFPEGD